MCIPLPVPQLVRLEDHLTALNAFDEIDQKLKDKIHERLQAKVEYDAQTGCWVYTGCWSREGQGRLRVGRRVYRLPRVSAWLYTEAFALEGPRVSYRTCACLACFNPDHLVIVRDQAAVRAGLRRVGRWAGAARKLSQAKADAVRLAYAVRGPAVPHTLFLRQQAKALGVALHTVRKILANRAWVKRTRAA